MLNSDKIIKVITVDDNKNLHEGLDILLGNQPEFEIIARYYNGKELLDSPELGLADLVLSDIDMPVMNGIDAAIRVNFKYPKLKLIALTMHLDKVYMEEIISAGFQGFVYKPNIAMELLDTINEVMNNKFAFPKNLKIK